MTKAELLAKLELQVERVLGIHIDHPKVAGVQKYRATVLEVTGLNQFREANRAFYVIDEGVVAGPQTYSEDVYDEDGTTLLHSAGDPILDENGDPVVIPEATHIHTEYDC